MNIQQILTKIYNLPRKRKQVYLIAWFYEVKTKKRVTNLIVTYILSHGKKIKTIPYLGNVL